MAGPLKDISGSILESKFVSGLIEEIQVEMRLFTLVGLKEKMNMALLNEETETAIMKRWTSGIRTQEKKDMGVRSTKQGGSNTQNSRLFTLHLNRSATFSSAMTASTARDTVGRFTSRGSYKRLPDNELMNKLAKGLCFRCDNKFSPGHRCKKQELQVMLYYDSEIDGEEEEKILEIAEETKKVAPATLEVMNIHEPELKDADLAINSMVGLDSPRTMKLLGTVGGRSVVVLIDSGASHNFIEEELIKDLGIP